MSKFSKYIILLSFIFCFLFIFSANHVFADCDKTNLPPKYGIWDKLQNCRDCGDCKLNDFVWIAVAVATWILGIIGSLALLFFIYGGVMFLISGGNQERVTKAKQIIVGAVLGLVIVFTSYMIINFVALALGVIPQGGSILQSGWFGN